MLYQKYRPTNFSQVVGNTATVNSLKALVEKPESCPHSLLFVGDTGCGKTTLARITAKQLGASENAITEVDSAQFRGIDTIRDIRQKSQFAPLEGNIRVWIIDEVHQLSKDAQNAFLKILEDTPKHVYFLLCTTDPEKLIKTIRSRCSIFTVGALEKSEIFKVLSRITKAEKAKVSKAAYMQIIKASEGRPREAIQLLEQVIAVPVDEQLKVIKQIKQQQHQAIELCRLLLKGASWKAVREVLKSVQKEDPEKIRRLVLSYLQSVLLNGENDTAAAIMEEFFEPFYDTGFPGLVYACYSCTRS